MIATHSSQDARFTVRRDAFETLFIRHALKSDSIEIRRHPEAVGGLQTLDEGCDVVRKVGVLDQASETCSAFSGDLKEDSADEVGVELFMSFAEMGFLREWEGHGEAGYERVWSSEFGWEIGHAGFLVLEPSLAWTCPRHEG